MKRAELERGAVAVVVGVCAVVLAGFATLTVDLGNARQLQIKAQGDGDAGALASAQDLPGSGADSTARAKGQAGTLVVAVYRATPVVATCGAGALADTTFYQITGSGDLEVTSRYEGTSQTIHARVCEGTPTF